MLDRGPYREILKTKPLANTALLSTVQSIGNVPDWSLRWNEPFGTEGRMADVYPGHQLQVVNGFRLHGFDLVFPTR